MKKGTKHSKEAREKMSIARIGRSFLGGWKLTKEHIDKIVESRKGKSHTEDSIKKMRKAKLGTKCSPETRVKMSKAHPPEKCNFWKGGVSSENMKIRKTIEYRLWRESVFARDNWTCQKYGIKGGKLCAHHIQNFANFTELRTSIENGITLSEKAHKEFHFIYGNRNNTKEQLLKFIE